MRGHELYGLCPNPKHGDKHAGSWSIHVEPGNKRNGCSHCYACGYNGDAFDCVAEIRAISRDAAVAFCSEYATNAEHQEKPVDEEAFERGGWYEIETVDMPETEGIIGGSKCMEYLSVRGVSIREVRQYGLRDWVRAERVLVPVKMFGRVVSWDAKLYGKDRRAAVSADTRAKKSLSPRKGVGGGNWRFSMWGMDGLNREVGGVVLVEGFWDAAHLRRIGVENVLAVRTTELTEEKAGLLGWCDRVLVVGDGDAAGKKMIENVRGWLANEERQVVGVQCEEGKDPDDYDLEGWKALVERAN
jgi:DNA primase